MTRDSYAFIYDDFLNDRKYERMLAELDARLASLDLVGRSGRLTLFRSAKDLVESMVSQGVTTIVVVGNDRTLDKVMWFLPDLDVTVGYLPVDEPSGVADVLGIPKGIEACDVLAARLIETLDVGKLDDRYFLTEVSLPQTIASVGIEGMYRISPPHGGSITVRNLSTGVANGVLAADARDGFLEVVVTPREEGNGKRRRGKKAEETRILLRRGEIVSPDPVEVFADNHVLNGMRFTLGIVPKKLKIVTGRNRKLSPVAEPLPKLKNVATLPTAFSWSMLKR